MFYKKKITAIVTALIGITVCFASHAKTEKFRVIISMKNAASVQGVRQLAQAAGGELHVDLPALNAFAISMPGQALAGLSHNPNIEYIEEDTKRYLVANTPYSPPYSDTAGNPQDTQVTPYGIPMVQADQLTYISGITVCIIDSGLDASQDDFNWSNISGSDDPGGTGSWDFDDNFHGTHVAGTIAAIDYNNKGVVGVNSNGNLPLHIVKVFTAAGWAYSSTLAAAAQDCADNDADVISMSLGGSIKNRTEQRKFDALNTAGVLSIAAAGNDGNSRHSYPASYSSVVSVAAVDNTGTVADFSQHTSQVEMAAPGVGVLSTQPIGGGSWAEAVVNTAVYSVHGMENTGTITAALYDFATGEDIDFGAGGKVCLIQRGTISFYDKVRTCEESDGVGAIIYNNVAGGFLGTLGETNDTTIPVVTASDVDGAAMLADVDSSATVTVEAGDYALYDGTSMATPHVSGVAALLWSNHAACSNQNIRDALNASAVDLGVAGRDDFYGNGLIQAAAADEWLGADCGASQDGGNGGGNGGNGGNEKPCNPKKPSCN